jgi:isochorismate synthase
MEQRLSDSNNIDLIKSSIQHLLLEGFEFAIYAHPNSNDIHCIVSEEKKQLEGFVLYSFNSEKTHLISADYYFQNNELLKVLQLKNHQSKVTFKSEIPKAKSKQDFENYVQEIIEKCSKNEIEKCVAARTIIHEINPQNLPDIFVNLWKNYPNAFVSFSVSKLGIWIGASPEILVKENNEFQYETMSLAGTKKADENRNWSKKEIEEQAIVTRYIEKRLGNHVEKISISEPSTHNAGHLQHIKTTISLQSKNSFTEIAKILHPTPAVCGLPLENAQDIIHQNETDRGLYAGFIGSTLAKQKCFYVNLRCMQIIENTAILYVGAGITAHSNPQSEWQETENKAQTLIKYLH